MEDRKAARLGSLARRVGKPTDDATLADALEDAENEVKNYCHLAEIPPALDTTVVRMARDIWRAEGYGAGQTPQAVTSIRRGDVTTSFAAPASTACTGAGFTAPYTKTLNVFRVPDFGGWPPKEKGGEAQ